MDLKLFKIRNFKKFILLFSLDFKHTYFNSINTLTSKEKFLIKNNKYVSKIKLNTTLSFFDKYTDYYQQCIKYYFKN